MYFGMCFTILCVRPFFYHTNTYAKVKCTREYCILECFDMNFLQEFIIPRNSPIPPYCYILFHNQPCSAWILNMDFPIAQMKGASWKKYKSYDPPHNKGIVVLIVWAETIFKFFWFSMKEIIKTTLVDFQPKIGKGVFLSWSILYNQDYVTRVLELL